MKFIEGQNPVSAIVPNGARLSHGDHITLVFGLKAVVWNMPDHLGLGHVAGLPPSFVPVGRVAGNVDGIVADTALVTAAC
ncbi:MAG: hypothetical protein OEZ59_13330 [Deltaproteobacteria bacterium]|nr:hypothetical protein [Deltaproteobacteria bacterium]